MVAGSFNGLQQDARGRGTQGRRKSGARSTAGSASLRASRINRSTTLDTTDRDAVASSVKTAPAALADLSPDQAYVKGNVLILYLTDSLRRSKTLKGRFNALSVSTSHLGAEDEGIQWDRVLIAETNATVLRVVTLYLCNILTNDRKAINLKLNSEEFEQTFQLLISMCK